MLHCRDRGGWALKKVRVIAGSAAVGALEPRRVLSDSLDRSKFLARRRMWPRHTICSKWYAKAKVSRNQGRSQVRNQSRETANTGKSRFKTPSEPILKAITGSAPFLSPMTVTLDSEKRLRTIDIEPDEHMLIKPGELIDIIELSPLTLA